MQKLRTLEESEIQHLVKHSYLFTVWSNFITSWVLHQKMAKKSVKFFSNLCEEVSSCIGNITVIHMGNQFVYMCTQRIE